MQAPRPQGMGIQMRGLPGAQGGAFTNADTFGAARHRQQQQLAKAGLYASVSMIDEDQNRRAKDDEAHALYANNALRIQDQEKGKALLEQYQGQKADKLPDAVVHHLDTIYSDIDRGLTNDHQREAFSRSFQAYKAQRLEEAYKQRDQQTTAFLETERKGQRKLIQQSTHKSISMETGFDEAINGANYAAYMLNIGRELQEKNLPKEAEELAFQAARKDWHTGNLETCAAVSPELALKYLDDVRVKGDDDKRAGVFSRAEMKEMRQKYGKEVISGAKKKAENDMRQLGIRLGDQFGSEYEIIDALRDVEDRELAKIAREEAETVRKARLAMGSDKNMTQEEKARDERVSRDLAQTVIRGVDQESPDDDITSEDELDVALDTALSKATEARREKVRKYAVAELKAKIVRQAQERKKLDQEALNTMAKSGWDVAAIDPSWPEGLQDKMLERIEKRDTVNARKEERLEKAEKKARGVGYLEMPLDELNTKILAGEWLDIVDDVGAGTSEFKKLEARLMGADKSGLTMLQFAKNEYTRIIGNPNDSKKQFADFNLKVDEARAAKARDLTIDNPDMIPSDVQKQIIKDLLTQGDFRYTSFWGSWSPNVYRFQVGENDLPDWRPVDQPVTPAERLPAFARQYFSPRDTRRDLLGNGNVLIESGNGVVTIVKPDGTFVNAQPKGNE